MRRAAFLTLVLLLAGCADGPAFAPKEPPLPATIDPAQAWVLLSDGCGFCAGDADTGEFRLVALQHDGTVLRVDYGMARSSGDGDGDREPANPALAAFQDYLDALPEGAKLYGEGPGRAPRAVGGVAARLAGPDLDAVTSRLEPALRNPGGQPSTRSDVTDCGARVLVALGGSAPAVAEHGCGITAGPGWRRVLDVMLALGDWVVGVGDPTLAGPSGSPVPALAGEMAYLSEAPVRAAMVAQACGGLLHGCSGQSGVLLRDGVVEAFWGTPWAAGQEGSTYCGTAQAAFDDLAARFGDAWRLSCGKGTTGPRAARIPAAAWPEVQAWLDGATLGGSDLGGAECCDRVFTTVHVYRDGEVRTLVFEGTGLSPTSPAAGLSPTLAQLLDLMAWLRPSLDDAWGLPKAP